MRGSLLSISVLGLAVVLAACGDSPSPTGELGPQFAASGSGGDTTGRPSQFISNGATADVWWSSSGDSLGGAWTTGYLTANRNSPVNDEWTSINWSITTCDAAWNCSYSSGYGFVNAALLTGRGGGDLYLAVDPSEYPESFYIYGDPIGRIELAWRQTAGFSSRTSGVTDYTYPGYRYRSNGVSVSSTAAVTGNIGATMVPAGTIGMMGTNHGMTITFFR